MRRFRIMAAVAAVTLAGATVGGPAVQAAETGAGTAVSDTTLLEVELNGLTTIEVLEDLSQSSIDTTVGTPEAFVAVTPLKATGFLEPVTSQIPRYESRTTGASKSTVGETITLPAQLGPIASGTIIPASLNAVVDGTGARASLNNSLADLLVGGALLSVNSVGNALNTSATKTNSTSARSASLDTLTAVDLGTLLAMLGLPLDALPLNTILDLLASLNLPVDGLSPAVVTDQVDDLLDAANSVSFLLDSLPAAGAAQVDVPIDVPTVPSDPADVGGDIGDTVDVVTDSLEEALGDLGITLPDLDDPDALLALLDELVTQLEDLLDDVLINLNVAPLVSLTDVGVELGTIASEKLADSLAIANASIGSLNVAGLSLPALDLLDTANQINTVIGTANGALSGVLGTIGGGAGLPTLADLVTVDLLDKSTSVEQVGNYVESNASLTVLTIRVTPPPQLSALVGSILAAPGVGDVIADLGGQLSALPSVGGFSAGDALNGVVGTTALSGGGTARVLSFSASADYSPNPLAAPPGSGTPGDETPRTGFESTLPLLLAAVFLAMGFGTRRWLRLARHTTR
jgi:hypothetical protein